MATAHVYVRAQVVGDAATVAKIKKLADSLNEALADAGGVAGSVSVVDDAPVETTVAPVAPHGRDTGTHKSK